MVTCNHQQSEILNFLQARYIYTLTRQLPPLPPPPPLCRLLIQELMDADYPSYDAVPFHSRWRHFEAGGIDRVTPLTKR
jgi:Protein of unknown function (DUF1688)